jgi:hypothetical protein
LLLLFFFFFFFLLLLFFYFLFFYFFLFFFFFLLLFFFYFLLFFYFLFFFYFLLFFYFLFFFFFLLFFYVLLSFFFFLLLLLLFFFFLFFISLNSSHPRIGLDSRFSQRWLGRVLFCILDSNTVQFRRSPICCLILAYFLSLTFRRNMSLPSSESMINVSKTINRSSARRLLLLVSCLAYSST